MKKVLFIALGLITFMAEWACAATPAGFANTTVAVNAQVNLTCEEVQHGAFPNPIMIDTQVTADQTFSPTADELVKCTKGAVFTVKVSSANGTALDQICTSGGVGNMTLKSASWPSDVIDYTFMCAGDTDGAGHFTGAGYNTAKALGIGVKVLAANAQAAFAHADYSDTVTVTLSY
jgi:hypothetical protein